MLHQKVGGQGLYYQMDTTTLKTQHKKFQPRIDRVLNILELLWGGGVGSFSLSLLIVTSKIDFRLSDAVTILK